MLSSVNLVFLVPVYSSPQILNLPRSLQTPGPDYEGERMIPKPAHSALRAAGSTAFSLCVKDGLLVLMTHRQGVGGRKSEHWLEAALLLPQAQRQYSTEQMIQTPLHSLHL